LRLAAGLVLLLAARGAGAQTNDHLFRSLRWWPDPTSARTAGLGGAAVALPDDTGAAGLNPANLTSLTRTEVTASLRRTGDGASRPESGTAASDPLGAHTTLGHLAGGGRIGTRWAVSAHITGSRQVRLRLDPRPLPGGVTDEGTFDGKVTAGGVAGAWQIGRALHVGARLDASRASVSGEYRSESPGRPADLRVGVGGASTRLAGGLGATWEATPGLRLGIAGSSGASYSLERTAVSPALNVTLDPGSTFRLRQPAVVSLGACVRASRQVTVVGQLDRVRYGEIRNALSIRLGARARADYALADAWEPRAGVEVSLPFRSASLQLRGGYHRAAPGSLRYEGPDDDVEEASFLGTAPESVVSAGASLATRGFRLDVAAQHSGPGDQLLVGVTGRF
jgi:hypothetical protein